MNDHDKDRMMCHLRQMRDNNRCWIFCESGQSKRVTSDSCLNNCRLYVKNEADECVKKTWKKNWINKLNSIR